MSDIEYKLRVFGFGLLQDLVSLVGVLEREEISFEDVKQYIKDRQTQLKEANLSMQKANKEARERWEKNTRRCPTCMKPLALRPINAPKGKGNREGYTCHWFCLGEKCMFEEYTHEDFKKVYQRIMEGEVEKWQ